MSKHKIEVQPQHQRTQVIAGLDTQKAKKADNWFVHEGKNTPLSVITLPIGTPIYRMGNGRTQTDQLAYIAAANAAGGVGAKVGADFFSAHEEDVAAQTEQHKILIKLAETGTDSITPIIEELSRTGQTKSILITPTGVVVDGNRRLAAMRELFASGKFPKFATIECEVLPQLTPDQLDDIEDRLQMRPETKLPYTWVNDAIRVQKRLKSKNEQQVSRLMRREKADIKKAVQALAFADIYLTEWLKAPNDYARVADGRQFFYDLVGRIKDEAGPLREVNMRIAWMMFDNRKNLGSRVYDFNKLLGNPEVAERLLEHFLDNEDDGDDEAESEANEGGNEAETPIVDHAPVPTEGASESGPTPSEPGDGLEIDFGEDAAPASPYTGLISALDDKDRREDLTEDFISVAQFVIDAGKVKQKGQAALSAAKDANKRLTELDLTEADAKTWDGLEKQLGAVAKRSTELLEALQDIRKKADQAKPT
ncbi:MAG: hypothetical protein M0D54_10765 [Hyphomonadaceae bacterium JAD_PAG50586_4]|nr:MAG: hypothetical protein M0D54_10765 [Hyphomonadaceae bacterium JAD_PAG50586_4]